MIVCSKNLRFAIPANEIVELIKFQKLDLKLEFSTRSQLSMPYRIIKKASDLMALLDGWVRLLSTCEVEVFFFHCPINLKSRDIPSKY